MFWRKKYTERSVDLTKEAADTISAWLNHYGFTQVSKENGVGLYRGRSSFKNLFAMKHFYLEARKADGQMHLRAFTKHPWFGWPRAISVGGPFGWLFMPTALAVNGLFRALDVELVPAPPRVRWHDWSILLTLGALIMIAGIYVLATYAMLEPLPFAKEESLRFTTRTGLIALSGYLTFVLFTFPIHLLVVRFGRTLWAKLFSSSWMVFNAFGAMAYAMVDIGLGEMGHLNKISLHCLDTPNQQTCEKVTQEFAKWQQERPVPKGLKMVIAEFQKTDPNNEDLKYLISRMPAFAPER